MSDYNNYNSYQQSSEPAAPIFIAPEAGADYQNYQQMPQQQEYSPGKMNAYGLISIILAPLSCCCCGFPAVIGLILGIVGLTKYKRNILCIVGIILCLLVIVYFAYSIFSGMSYIAENPEEIQEIMDMYMDIYEQQMEQMEQSAGAFIGK